MEVIKKVEELENKLKEIKHILHSLIEDSDVQSLLFETFSELIDIVIKKLIEKERLKEKHKKQKELIEKVPNNRTN